MVHVIGQYHLYSASVSGALTSISVFS